MSPRVLRAIGVGRISAVPRPQRDPHAAERQAVASKPTPTTTPTLPAADHRPGCPSRGETRPARARHCLACLPVTHLRGTASVPGCLSGRGARPRPSHSKTGSCHRPSPRHVPGRKAFHAQDGGTGAASACRDTRVTVSTRAESRAGSISPASKDTCQVGSRTPQRHPQTPPAAVPGAARAAVRAPAPTPVPAAATAAAAAGFRRRRRGLWLWFGRRYRMWGRWLQRFRPRRFRPRRFRLDGFPGHFVAGHRCCTRQICRHPEMIPSRAHCHRAAANGLVMTEGRRRPRRPGVRQRRGT
jgi:hypothetical protein